MLSIITITFNAAQTLQRTIDSIKNQSYKNIEYIIIDGASTDETIDIIQRNADCITHWISEKDNGLYDAMNKGLAMATGSYVWFINSGDEIKSPTTVADMFAACPNADVIYGETVMTDINGNEIGNRRLTPPEHLTYRDFKRGMLVSHQSFIAKRSLAEPYNLKYRFSADYEWCLKILRKSTIIANSHLVLSRFLDGGITKHNIIPGLKERFTIMVQQFGLIPTLLNHIPIALKFFTFWARNKRF